MDLLKGFHDRGHLVCVMFDENVVLSTDVNETLCYYAKLGIIRLPMSKEPSFNDINITFKILRLVARNEFDIVHGHGAKGGLYARMLAVFGVKKNAKICYTLHGGSLHYNPQTIIGFVYLSIEKLLLYFTTGLIFESKYSLSCFINKVAQPKCHKQVIYNGIHDCEFINIIHFSNATDFVFLGELRILKGLDILINALYMLQSEGYIIGLHIFGTGPDEKYFRKLEAGLGIHNLFWHGMAANAREALKYGRCLIVPSLAESLPYVIIESVAMGVPVIATNVGGVSEILNGTEELVIPGSVDDLANKMRRYLDGDLRVVGDIDISRNRAKLLFNVAHMVDCTLAFYNNCLQSKSM
jgi:glycosyltransferase involved in cell wall biosynthesis